MNSFQYAGTIIASIITISSALLTVNPSILKNLGVSNDGRSKRITILLLMTICSGFLFSFFLLVDIDANVKTANTLTAGAFLLTLGFFFSVILNFAFAKTAAQTATFVGRVASISPMPDDEWKDVVVYLQLDKQSKDSYLEYQSKDSTDRIKLTFNVSANDEGKTFKYSCKETLPPVEYVVVQLTYNEAQNIIIDRLKIKGSANEVEYPITLVLLP